MSDGLGFTVADAPLTATIVDDQPTAAALVDVQPVEVELPAAQGADGLSAYAVALRNGYSGSEADWIASLHAADSRGVGYPTRTDLEAGEASLLLLGSNQGLSNYSEGGRLESIPLSLLKPSPKIVAVNSNTPVKDFVQIDPRDTFPNAVHFANTGLTSWTRYDFSLLIPGALYLVAAGNSPVILDPGLFATSWGNGEMVPRNCELFLAPGDAVLISGTPSVRYVFLLSNARAGRFAGRTRYGKEADGTWTLEGVTQAVAAGATIVIDLSTLALGTFAFSPLQVDGSSSMAAGIGYLGYVTATKAAPVGGAVATDPDTVVGGLDVYKIIPGNAATGTTAQISIKNAYQSLRSISWQIKNLDAGTQRGYTGARFVRLIRPLFAGQSLIGHFIQNYAGDAYRKRITGALGVPNYVMGIAAAIGGTQACYTTWYAAGAGKAPVDMDGDPTTMGLPHFWWNDVANIYGAANTPGPILNNVLTTINKLTLTELPTSIEWNLGQTDTGALDTTLQPYEYPLDLAMGKAAFLASVQQIIAALRAAISARSVALGGPVIPASALPCHVHPLGRRYGFPGPLGWHVVRQLQYALQRLIPNCYAGPETYDTESHDGLHIAATSAGQGIQGVAAANCVLIDQFGVRSYTDPANVAHKVRRGPSIGTVTKVNATTLAIQIVPEDVSDTILYPTGVVGPLGNALPDWRFSDKATPIASDGTYTGTLANYTHAVTAASFSVDVNNLMTVTLSAPIAGDVLVYYPFDNCPDFTARAPCYIREAETGRPLNGFFQG